MEFFIKTDELQRAIKLLSVTVRTNVDTYESLISLTTTDGGIRFTANNGKTGLSCVVPATVKSSGEIFVVYGKVKSFVMSVQPWTGTHGVEEIHFTSDQDKLKIRAIFINADGSKFRSNLNADLVKSIPLPKLSLIEQPNLILNSSLLKTAVDKVIYAVDAKGPVLYTTGICMSFTSDSIKFAATDGRVLCEYIISNDSNLKEGAYLLPYECIVGLRRILVDDAQLFFEITSKSMKVEFNDILYTGQIISLKINRDYPDYAKQFTLFKQSVKVNRDIILYGLASFMDLLESEDYNRLSLSIANKKLVLKTEQAYFEYELSGIDDTVFVDVDMDGKDLSDTLYSIGSEIFYLKFIDEKHGIVFEAEGPEKQNAYIVNLFKR